MCSLTQVEQTDEFGLWEDEFEDDIDSFGGFKSLDEAMDFLKDQRVKEIYYENDLVWSKLRK